MRKHLITASVALSVLSAPVAADEFTDVIGSALDAYEEGDISIAREELDYAMKLLIELKSQSLGNLLPEALPGWTRANADAEGAGLAMGMFGGGTTATAKYSNDAGDLTITLVANSPMVSSMAGMITGLAGIGGKPMRIQRTQFSDNNGELQGVVDKRVLVSVSGEASLESKKAYLEAMDFKAIRDF